MHIIVLSLTSRHRKGGPTNSVAQNIHYFITMRTRSNLICKNGIHWYYEQEGAGPHVVLVPDGIGDCGMFDKPMSRIAEKGFTVTTFDMPGMSRSSNAPSETYQEVTAQKLARYVIGICDELSIDVATFWGCSSGGCTVLALAADYPDRVRNALPHEVPTYLMDHLEDVMAGDDDTISRRLTDLASSSTSGDLQVWDALGEEMRTRMYKNWPRWARGYPGFIPQSTPLGKDDLARRPLDWTVGASTPTHLFLDNIVTATKSDIPLQLLPGKHSPYVSHPEEWADYVVEKTRKYL